MRCKLAYSPIVVLCLTLIGFSQVHGGLQQLVVDPFATQAKPNFQVTPDREGNLKVKMWLPALQVEEIAADGIVYHALTIPGGSIDGQSGQPGLPTLSHLISVPHGAKVSVRVVSKNERLLTGYRVFPVQPADAEKFIVDPAAYTKTTGDVAPLVEIGEVAYMRHVGVAPVTFRPVRYDPTRDELHVFSDLEVEFTFEGPRGGGTSVGEPDYIPESFDHIYRDTVWGYSRSNSMSTVGPGSYLVICPDNSSVITSLQPLLDWRRRQGYNVILATLSQTGSSNSLIKNYIQGLYDSLEIPLEFVVLAGDANGSVAVPTWYENVTWYHGEGDHYYTTLEGNDILADIHIGRLSCSTSSQLQIIVNKIVNYETSPPVGDAEWFTRASLTGDPGASGITTVYVNQWLKNQLLGIGYTRVDTIWSGNFVSQMMANLNAGCSVFGYRGWLGMSQMSTSHIGSATNGGELPFAVIVTCDTGSFADDSNCRSEAFLRASNGGGIASVGTATTGTHTRYNNCYYQGVWNGVINSADHRVGVAHTLGKLELYRNYQLAEPDKVETWSTWNNLMGDPATEMWTAFPTTMNVNYPAALPIEANAVPVTVTVSGSPLSNAQVSLYKSNEVLVSGYTNNAGQVILPINANSSGGLRVTVTRHDHLPYQGSLNLGSVTAFAGVVAVNIDDDDVIPTVGNGDGIPNPGETIGLSVALQNLGSGFTQGVSASLTSGDPYVNVTAENCVYGDIGSGETVWGQSQFVFELDPSAPDGHELELELIATDGSESWSSLIPMAVSSAAFSLETITWSGPGGNLDPGETGNLNIQIQNIGSISAANVSAHLTTTSPWVVVTDPDADFGTVAVGAIANHNQDPLVLDISQSCFEGHLASFTLTFLFNGQAMAIAEFSLPIGSVSSNDPVGPDRYGYYAFDNTDTDYTFAPVYDWVEIDPNYGGNGTDVGLTDFGWEQDDTKAVDLPFTFRYYGQDYNQISICSNGWIAMGVTYLVHYRNWSIPSAGSPDAMIAAFWDNLDQAGTNRVYTWYDEANDRFIIQWSRLRNDYSNALQNFEIILYSPAMYPTATGDGQILFQYHTVGNTDSRDGYASVGIQNQDRTDGVLYTYWNQYAPGASSLTSGRAILFLPVVTVALATCDVSPLAISHTLAEGETTTEWLHISNNGEPGSTLLYTLELIDPNYPTIPAVAGARNLGNSSVGADPEVYVTNTTIDMVFTVTNASFDSEWIMGLSLDFPGGVYVNSATALEGGWGGPIPYEGATGDGVLAVWSAGGFLLGGDQASTTVNLSFNSVGGDVVIPWELTGSGTGNPPHQLTGVIVLTQTGPGVYVIAPNGGEAWAIDEVQDIQFDAQFGPEFITIELQRETGGAWEILATDVPAVSGSMPWTVTGPTTAEARVRVTDQDDPSLTDVSDAPFTIYRTLSWIQLDNSGGMVEQGTTADIEVTLDATGLPDDLYEAEIVVLNSASEPVVVPVDLTVATGPSAVAEELPTTLVLEDNYPNPFNPRTAISFALPQDGQVRLVIYSMTGRRITTLLDGLQPAGRHHVIWDGRDENGRTVASGVYFYRLEAGQDVLSRKMVLMK